MKCWVWPVTPTNWPVVKSDKVWAVDTSRKGKHVKKGDIIIFYVNTSTYFQGAFKVASDWHEPKTDWPDKSRDPPVLEIDLEEIELGFASVRELLQSLEFIEKKKRIGTYLRGSAMGPANFGRPISGSDHDAILSKLKSTKRRPVDEYKTGSDVEEMEEVRDWKFLEGRIHKLQAPNLWEISSIIRSVKAGELAVPVFQRKFEWNTKQIRDLWESIFQGFFVGTILTWSDNKSVKVNSVEGGPGLGVVSDIILDGQQRITSLYKAVVPDGNAKEDLFFVDLKSLLDPDSGITDTVVSFKRDTAENKGYLNKNMQFAKKLFPIYAFNSDYQIWLNEFKNYLENEESYPSDEASKYYHYLTKTMEDVWFKFRIPTVQLPATMELERVAEVFERINTKGTRLVMFDLLNAKFIMKGIELKTLWNDTLNDFPDISKITKPDNDISKMFIQSLSLYKKGSFRRKELFNLDASYIEHGSFDIAGFKRDWHNMCVCFSDTLEKVRSQNGSGFGAITPAMIPYTPTIPIMAALAGKISGRDDRDSCMKKIEAWYWSVIFSDRYSGSTDTKAEKDFREMQEWFDDNDAVPTIVGSQRNRLNDIEFSSTNRSGAMFKAIMCLVMRNRPLDFFDDGPPNPKESGPHRIFPEVPTGREKTVHLDSCLNMTMVSDSTWTKFMKGSSPSSYIEKISAQLKNKATLEKRLLAHLVSSDALECMKRNDYAGFINARISSIRKELSALINLESPAEVGIEKFLYKHESQKLEYKSTLRWSIREKKVCRDLECEVAETLSAFMNTGGGKLLIGVKDDGEPVGLEMDYSTLKQKNWDGFLQQLNSVIANKLDVKGGAHRFVKSELHHVDGKDICLCSVVGATSEVYEKCNDKSEFFIRIDNKTQWCDIKKAKEHIETWDWKSHAGHD